MRALVAAAVLLWSAVAAAQPAAATPTDEKGLEALVAREPKNGRAWFGLGLARQQAGKLDGAAAAYEKAIELRALVPVASYNLATVHARRGEADRAFAMLEQAAKAGFARLDDMDKDPDLATLRSHPRWKEARGRIEAALYPCKGNPLNRQLDFWVGDWDVFSPAGQQVGTSSVKLILGDCVVFENWTSRLGGTGKSFNFYSPGKKLWQQTYIDDKGSVLEITGAFSGGAMRYESEVLTDEGGKTRQKLTFTPLPDGRVRQLWEQSDDGKTWSTLFEGFYKRQK